MRILLANYHFERPLAEGVEEVNEVEFTSQVDQYMTWREIFICIRMGNKLAKVKADELKKVVEASI